jgi:hypothetical protein
MPISVFTASNSYYFRYVTSSGGWTWYGSVPFLEVGWGNSQNYQEGNLIRFPGINIPAGCLINSAYLTIQANASYSYTTVNSVIIGHKDPFAIAPTTKGTYQAIRGTIVGGPNNDNITSALVYWDGIPGWTNLNWYNSPEIKTVVQEIVNVPSWQNIIQLFWDDYANRSTHNDTRVRNGRVAGLTLTINWGPANAEHNRKIRPNFRRIGT